MRCRNICTLLLTNTKCPMRLNIVVLIIDKFVIHCMCRKEDLSDEQFSCPQLTTHKHDTTSVQLTSRPTAAALTLAPEVSLGNCSP